MSRPPEFVVPTSCSGKVDKNSQFGGSLLRCYTAVLLQCVPASKGDFEACTIEVMQGCNMYYTTCSTQGPMKPLPPTRKTSWRSQSELRSNTASLHEQTKQPLSFDSTGITDRIGLEQLRFLIAITGACHVEPPVAPITQDPPHLSKLISLGIWRASECFANVTVIAPQGGHPVDSLRL